MSVYTIAGGRYWDAETLDADVAGLDSLYAGKTAYYGEMHDHSNSGGRSDGKELLSIWPTEIMPEVGMDFAVIVDHKQSEHMRLPEWDNQKFVGGTEAGVVLTDEHLIQRAMHYNLIMGDPDKQDALIQFFPAYKFRPDPDHPGINTFSYGQRTIEALREIAAKTREMGGFFVHAHPLFPSFMRTEEKTDYWMGDYTGFEIYTSSYRDFLPSLEYCKAAYDIWVDLLNMGKKFYATCGSDSHRRSNSRSLATFYAKSTDSKVLLELMRSGNFTAGPIGIRMAVGDTCMGGETDFAGKRLVVSAGDFHTKVYEADHSYRLNVYNEKGLVLSRELTGTDTVYCAIETENCMYYRAEVYDVTGDYAVSVGNPVWNIKNNKEDKEC